MKAQRGIALIASLLIMAAVMALGVGSLFLTDMNLKISENGRSNSLARYHAEAGVDTAFVLLADHYEKTKAFPSTFMLPVTSGQEYQLLTYQPYTNPQRAMVRVEGSTSNNARFVAEALFQSATYRAFEKGLVTNGKIDLSGGGMAEFLNAGMHANGGVVKLSGYSAGVFKECTWGTLSGGGEGCLSASGTATPTPITSSGHSTCVSPCFDNNAKPVVIAPEFYKKRNQTIRDAYVPPPPSLIREKSPSNSVSAIMEGMHDNEMFCHKVYSGTQTLTEADIASIKAQVTTLPAVICIDNNLGNTNPTVGALNLPANVNLSDVTIVADGHITFGQTVVSGSTSVPATGPAASLTNVKLISKTGGVMLNKVLGTHLSIFSGANRDFGSTQSNKPPTFLITKDFDLRGYTTIASNETIEFDGKTNVTTRPNLSDAITISIISDKDIYNGGSFDFYGVFWAGGKFHQSGASMIYGSVVTVQDITTSGRLRINSSYAVDNPYLDGDVVVSSRR